ncbi:MAG: biopolymer transporter ExbD [Bacteriovoracaceae bacterium]|nr:biopolymer transporter ExbD [Bacteriovoracaceae bacterium]
MLKVPTARRRRKEEKRIDLVPIMDSIFIFIFFLLMSTNFINVLEISSDIPIISSEPEPENKEKPLALMVSVAQNTITVSTGVPSKVVKTIGKNDEGKYNLEELRDFLVTIKKSNPKEEMVILEPTVDLEYEILVNIMDALRLLRKTDDAIYRRNKDGLDEKVETLFSNIIFGNITG